MSNFFACVEVVLTGLITSAAQILLRKGAPEIVLTRGLKPFFASVLKVPLLTGGFLAAGAPLLYFHALQILPLSLAFGLSALSYIWVPLGGWLFLREHISRRRLTGTVSIITGLLIWSIGL